MREVAELVSEGFEADAPPPTEVYRRIIQPPFGAANGFVNVS
jgi:hypothetical protein